MAIIVKEPKLILTQKELDTLDEARKIIAEIADQDESCAIFEKVDNFDSELWFIVTAIENLENIAEVD